MKKIIITIIFLLLVSEIAYLWLQNHPGTHVGGHFLESPDKKYDADAWNKVDRFIFCNTEKNITNSQYLNHRTQTRNLRESSLNLNKTKKCLICEAIRR
jgi:hypothetical protein